MLRMGLVLALVGVQALLIASTAATADDASDSALLARGDYLVNGVVACGNCHTPQRQDQVPVPGMEMAGGFVVENPDFRAYAPNITPDPDFGIGKWSDDEIIAAIRRGIRPDGSIIGPPMPVMFYKDMSDRDVGAIVAYLRQVPPVKNIVPKSGYRVPLPPSWGLPDVSVAGPDVSDKVEYGAYLSGALGHCFECHTPIRQGQLQIDEWGAGGNVYDGVFGLDATSVSANITPHPSDGISHYSDSELATIISTGVRPDGSHVAPPMGFYYYQNIKPEDLNAIIAYLRTIPPLPFPEMP